MPRAPQRFGFERKWVLGLLAHSREQRHAVPRRVGKDAKPTNMWNLGLGYNGLAAVLRVEGFGAFEGGLVDPPASGL